MQSEMITQQDLDYLAQQSAGNVNMIIAGMTALMNDTDNKVSMMESQTWFQRMCRTISGKNKMTVQEIQQNHEKINLYMSQAMKHMYEQQMVDRQIMMSLGNQLNEIYQEHVQLKQMLGAFVSKLNEKIESIDNFHMLNTEIEQGLYSGYVPVVAVITILSQLDKRCIQDYRKMNILKNSMRGKGILRDAETPLQEIMASIVAVPQEMVGAIYIELNSIRGNYVADLFLRLIEGYHFLPDMVRKMKDRKTVIAAIIKEAQLDANVSLSEQTIFDSLVESKLDLLEGFVPISEIYYDVKLREAEQLFNSCQFDDAFELFKSLAEKGVGRAMYFMSEYYSGKYGKIEWDGDKEDDWLDEGLACGDVLSSFILSSNLTKGEQKRLREQIQELADQGDTVAQYVLGKKSSIERCIYWCTRAAEGGCILGMRELATAFYIDDDVRYKWARRLAEMGDAMGQWFLGAWYYDHGEDNREAIKWYKLSAEQGFADAQVDLGDMYYDGKGVEQDYGEAAKWYLKAAAHMGGLINREESVLANRLGDLYQNGMGVGKNVYEAVKWYQKAAEDFNTDALYNLANCYHDGIGIQQDYEEAVKLYQEAAGCEHAAAMDALGECYARGEGVKKDYDKAFKWFKKAVKQGYSDFNLKKYETVKWFEETSAEIESWSWDEL